MVTPNPLNEFSALANDPERDAWNLVPDHSVGNTIANSGEQFFDVHHASVSAENEYTVASVTGSYPIF